MNRLAWALTIQFLRFSVVGDTKMLFNSLTEPNDNWTYFKCEIWISNEFTNLKQQNGTDQTEQLQNDEKKV